MGEEFVGKNVADAIKSGLEKLQLDKSLAKIEVLDEGGFLRKAKVLISKRTEGEAACDFIEKLTEKMGINCVLELVEDDERAVINIISTEGGALIGHRGDVLDAMQYLASMAVNRSNDTYKRIVLDCENYREKREETLSSLGKKLAEKAVKNARRVVLEPMNPYERRVIHASLSEDDRVSTSSEGIEPNRYVVITPKNAKPFDRAPNNNRDRNGFNRERTDGFRKPYNKDFAPRTEGGERSNGYNRDRNDNSERNDGFRKPYNKDFAPRTEGGERSNGYNRDRNSGGERSGGFNRDRNFNRDRDDRAERPKKTSAVEAISQGFGTTFGFVGKADETKED